MEKFIEDYWVILLVVILWSIPWKGVALLVINTVGILEILYIFVFSKRSRASSLKGSNESEQ